MAFHALRVLAAIACVGHAMAAVPEGEFVSSAMIDDSLPAGAPEVFSEGQTAVGGGIISFASVDSSVADAASIDDEPAVDEEIAAGADVASASNPGCLATINKFRRSLGIPGMKYLQSKQQCVNRQAKNDYMYGWHDSFGDCDEWAQTECRGPSDQVHGCIQAYIDEGESGKHYQIITNPNYKYATCGVYKANSKTSFYTQDFFLDNSGNPGSTTSTPKPTTTPRPTTTVRPPTTTARPPTTSTPRPTSTSIATPTSTGSGGLGTTPLNNRPGVSSQECLDYLNKFRRSQGVPELTYNRAKEPCANQQAYDDNIRGFHATFRACGESSQCEGNGYRTIQQNIDAYIAEGPGGGHYEIIKNSRFTSVACGVYDKGNGGYFFTQDFY